jgi:hypothetical protein
MRKHIRHFYTDSYTEHITHSGNTTLTIQPVLISCDVKTNIHVHLSHNYHLTTNHLGYGNRCLRLPYASGAHDYRRFS